MLFSQRVYTLMDTLTFITFGKEFGVSGFSNYEIANGPEFEMSYDRGNEMYEIEIWIPCG